MATEVHDNQDASRYQVTLDGKLAGFAIYVRKGSRGIFTHTEIDLAFEGHGLGSALAHGALTAERDAGRKVVPLCPFVAHYIERHPEFAPLVDAELLEMLETS